MNEFNDYLIQKGFGLTTADSYRYFIEKRFMTWLHENQIAIETLDHETIMQYIRYRRTTGVKPKTINMELKKISYFLTFKELENVAEPIRVKGVERRIPHDVFSGKELDAIYKRFPESRNAWTHDNILKTYHLILGLKIYQGMVEGEIAKLETSHLMLEKGRIYVPSTRRTNKRILELKSFQVLPFQEYLLNERKRLVNEIEGDFLFHAKRLKRGLPIICTMIKRYEPRLTSLLQIRSSVITNWLGCYNLREVQYMAGHRYVSSTERYRTDNLEDLQKELEKYHPLR